MVMLFGKKRDRRRWIGALAAVALLIAQIAVSAYACPDGTKTVKLGAGSMTQHAGQPCAGLDADQPSLCNEHCKSQASAEAVQVPAMPPAMPSGLAVPAADFHRILPLSRYAAPDRDRPTIPPPSILFCVFNS
jgi:hypothetical protein